MQWVMWVVLGYLIGSISGSLVLGNLKGTDIRQAGSGNAGGTNALRTQGWKFALGVVFIDVGKGAVAVALLPPGDHLVFGYPLSHALLQCAVAFACVLGHIYPVFFGFRGGKGAATYVGALLVIAPLAFCGVFSTWALLLVLSGYVGPATVVAAAIAPLATWAVAPHLQRGDYFFGGIVMSALVIFAHRENLQRLWRGTESRFQRVQLWGGE